MVLSVLFGLNVCVKNPCVRNLELLRSSIHIRRFAVEDKLIDVVHNERQAILVAHCDQAFSISHNRYCESGQTWSVEACNREAVILVIHLKYDPILYTSQFNHKWSI